MLTRARLKVLASLHRREVRITEGIYLVDGPRTVGEALASGAGVTDLLLTHAFASSPAGPALTRAAEGRGVPVTLIGEKESVRLSDTRTPQGAFAVLSRVEPDAEILVGDGLFLILDAVADPGNVGTLIRAADAFGCRAVVSGPGSADFENQKVLRAAMGSSFHLSLIRVGDLCSLLSKMTGSGAGILAATLSGADAYEVGASMGRRTGLVLGNEARGVSSEVLAAATAQVTVPCPGRAESLNVAMAGAILLSILARGDGGKS
jgi:RNA methyltransferase, TrmH family